MNIQPNAFASTFYFFADTQGNAKKIKRACKPPLPDNSSVQCKLRRTKLRTDRRASGNSTYKKLAVQWLNEALCPETSGFIAGRQFSSPKSPTSCSCKTLAEMAWRPC